MNSCELLLKIICFLFGSFLIGNATFGVLTGSIYDTENREWTSREEKPKSFWVEVLLYVALGIFVLAIGFFRLEVFGWFLMLDSAIEKT